jgi:hypothetical protein
MSYTNNVLIQSFMNPYWPASMTCVALPFSQHVLQHPIVQGEFADESLQRRVLTLKRAQLLGIGDVHPAKLAPPPIQRLLGNIRVHPD